MRTDDKYFITGLVFFVIWLLGVVWHPFGTPKTIWHVMFLGMSIVLWGVAVYELRKNETEDDLENEELNTKENTKSK